MSDYSMELHTCDGQMTEFKSSDGSIWSYLITEIDGRHFRYAYEPSKMSRKQAEQKFKEWLDENKGKSDSELSR